MVIPESVTYLEGENFYGCTGLVDVYFCNVETEISFSVFNGVGYSQYTIHCFENSDVAIIASILGINIDYIV